MRRYHTILFSVLFFIFALLLTAHTSVLAATPTKNNPKVYNELQHLQISAPNLEIRIPGLSFSNLANIQMQTGPEGSQYVEIPFLGQYIMAVYKYAVIVAGIVAVIMIIFSGIQWMLPGNIITSIITKTGGERQEESINSAKKRIIGAIVGLILAVGSYTILYTVNPNLVKFKNLRVTFIQGKYAEGIPDKYINTPQNKLILPKIGAGVTLKINSKKDYPSANTTYLRQFDGYYQNKKYSRNYSDINTIIIHEGAPSIIGTLNAWENASQSYGYGITAHYIISRKGIVYQILDELIAGNQANKANSRSIGIDLAIPPKCSQRSRYPEFHTCANYTDAQYTALETLIKNIQTRAKKIIYDDAHILLHCQVLDSLHVDARNFDFSKIDLNNNKHWKTWIASSPWSGHDCSKKKVRLQNL